MRRSLICSALVWSTALAVPATPLWAAPAVTFKATVLPIVGFPGTGYKLGAGAALRSQFTISGTESTGGVPTQLRQVAYYLPMGARLNTSAFATCPASTLENNGPESCPKGSIASPVGAADVVDPIGGELVRERSTLQAFFAPGGGLSFYSNAAAPISAQIVAKGRVETAGAPYGQKVVTEVPLVDSVPGAPPVSVTSIDVKVGAAVKRGRKTIYYGTVPKKCPKSGFPEKAELTFQTGEVVVVTTKLPCPKH